MKYFSLFSGIGGFEKGIQQALHNTEIAGLEGAEKAEGIQRVKPNNKGEYGGHISNVGYSEIDKYAIQVYEKHFKHKNYGDCTKIDATKLPDFDLLVGGFPCQAFSVAGKRQGFKDTRGTLFFDIARICKEKKPKHILLENVKGLLSHERGETFKTIIGVLPDIGYDVEWQLLNSKDFGVPQNRERVFIIGHLRGECGRKVFPLTQGNTKNLKEITQEVSDAQRIYSSEGIAKTLKGEGGGQGAKTGLYAMRGREKGQQLEYRGDKTNALTSVQKDNLYVKDMRIRRLTPTECERLQGFPDGWTEGLSDTQRYKCLGNAVTVNVIEAIIHNFNCVLSY